MVHTLKGCPACEDLQRPNNFAQFKDLVLQNDPQAKIVIFEHPAWGKMIRTEEYPNFGFIRWAPTIMITSQDNMSNKGDPKKVRILNGKYDAASNTISKVLPEVSISKGLPPLIKEVMAESKTLVKPTAIIPPISDVPPILPQPKQLPVPSVKSNPPENQGMKKCKFDLVSYK